MDVLHISDIQWTNEFLVVPGTKKRYSLHHLYIGVDNASVADHVPAPDETAREYLLKHHRTHELLCRIRVSESEQNEYRAFENQLLNSRLR